MTVDETVKRKGKHTGKQLYGTVAPRLMAPSYWKIDEEAEENQAMVGQQGGEVDAGTMGRQGPERGTRGARSGAKTRQSA